MKLDEIDLHILEVLQDNARIPIQDLAERVGLSPTPCSRRLRRRRESSRSTSLYWTLRSWALTQRPF